MVEERKLINMVNYTARVYDDVTLSQLKPGSLFSIFETGDNGVTELLALKTEYGNNEGGVDAYLLGSGERLSCDGKTSTKEGCDNVFVRPIELYVSRNNYFGMWNRLKTKIKKDLNEPTEEQTMAESIHNSINDKYFLKCMQEIEEQEAANDISCSVKAIQNLYKSSDIVMSELLRNNLATATLEKEEIKYLLDWAGDSEYVSTDELYEETRRSPNRLKNFKKCKCPNCGMELMDLYPHIDGQSFFMCLNCGVDVLISDTNYDDEEEGE